MSDYQSADLQERTKSRVVTPDGSAAEKQAVPQHPVVALQKHVGNAAVARMLAQRSGAEEEEPLQGKHDLAQRVEQEEEELLQGKHDMAQRVEEEEPLQGKHDVAQRVEEEEPLQGKHDLAQRVEEEEPLQGKHDMAQRVEEEEPLQGKHDVARATTGAIGLEGGPVDEEMQQQINSSRGSGSALDESVRTKAEDALGADFSGVRVHTDSQSDQLNRSMTAKAFTTGSDIYLRGDQSASNTQLMAHELTHVVQQQSGSVRTGGGMSVGAADDPHEHEADAMAKSVMSGAPQRKKDESGE